MIKRQNQYLTIIAIFLLAAASTESQVVVNEIMAAPTGGEPEWIELYNPSDNDLLLDSSTLSDNVSTKDLPRIFLSAGGYALLTKDTNALKTARQIPTDCLMIEASVPGLNNTYDVVVIKKAGGEIIDSVYYDMDWGEKGFSLERVDFRQPAVSCENLKKSCDTSGATPGAENCNHICEYDLIISALPLSAKPPEKFEFVIKNIGARETGEYSIGAYCDLDGNSIFSRNEMIEEVSPGRISPGDSIIYEIKYDNIASFTGRSGYMYLASIVSCVHDEKPENDTSGLIIFISPPQGSVLINEFMFDVSEGHAEYVELWNASEKTINLRGWALGDRAADSEDDLFIIGGDSLMLSPGSYALLSWDEVIFSNFPYLADSANVHIRDHKLNLNADADDITLLDASRRVQDSLTYSDRWHDPSIISTKNISLEKIKPESKSTEPDSWNSSSDPMGGTPARKNSIAREPAGRLKLNIEPNPFSPFGAAEEECLISFSLPVERAIIEARIFDLNGIMLRIISSGESYGAYGELRWDGRNGEGFSLPAGPYVLLFEASDSNSDRVYQEKELIVIGK